MFFKSIYYIFLLALIVIGGLFLVSVLPIPGNLDVKIVLSGSMEPAIKVGSVVVIKPSKKYDVNDVITFGKDTKKDVPTTHRIVDERVVSGNTLYTTKGDANEKVDVRGIDPRHDRDRLGCAGRGRRERDQGRQEARRD